MSHEVAVEGVDCVPEFDHCGNPPRETRTFVRIDTEARTCRVHQEDRRYELTQEEFNNVIVVHPLPCRPDEDALEAWLEGEIGQELLSDICDWRTEAGLEKLLARLDAAVAMLEPDDTQLWHAADWFSETRPAVEATTGDDDIRRLAQREYDDALGEGATVEGIYEYLIARRDELRAEAVTDDQGDDDG